MVNLCATKLSSIEKVSFKSVGNTECPLANCTGHNGQHCQLLSNKHMPQGFPLHYNIMTHYQIIL